jgi:Uma2 family endonuclease
VPSSSSRSSERDETYEKLPFYAARAVQEVLIVHQERQVELYRLRTDGSYVLTDDGTGSAASAVLMASFRTVAGPALRVDWDGGSVEV